MSGSHRRTPRLVVTALHICGPAVYRVVLNKPSLSSPQDLALGGHHVPILLSLTGPLPHTTRCWFPRLSPQPLRRRHSVSFALSQRARIRACRDLDLLILQCSLLTTLLIAPLAFAQAPVLETDEETGIAFVTQTNEGDAFFKFGIALPSTALEEDADEYIGLLVCITCYFCALRLRDASMLPGLSRTGPNSISTLAGSH